VKSILIGQASGVTTVCYYSNSTRANKGYTKGYTMTHRLFGAVAAAALASFAAATPGSAKFDSPKPSALIALQITQQSCPALKLAMGPTSAPQKPGGTGEAPADTQLQKSHQAQT
jgi:hypothetical protein